MKSIKPFILLVALVLITALIIYLQFIKLPKSLPGDGDITPANLSKEEKIKKYPLAKEITTPDGFINTGKISVSEFIGKKVVLIDFWTYSCINCQRTIPYLNSWYEIYKDN